MQDENNVDFKRDILHKVFYFKVRELSPSFA